MLQQVGLHLAIRLNHPTYGFGVDIVSLVSGRGGNQSFFVDHIGIEKQDTPRIPCRRDRLLCG